MIWCNAINARVLESSHVLRYKPHACLRIELPHLTRRLLVARATRANIKADFFSLSAPRMGKWVTGCEKGLRVYDRAPSPLGRRQVNGNCLQGGFPDLAALVERLGRPAVLFIKRARRKLQRTAQGHMRTGQVPKSAGAAWRGGDN